MVADPGPRRARGVKALQIYTKLEGDGLSGGVQQACLEAARLVRFAAEGPSVLAEPEGRP